MSSLSSYYHQDCLKNSFFAAAATYFIFTDKNMPPSSRFFSVLASAVSMYAFRYFYNSTSSVLCINIPQPDTPEYRLAFERAFDRLKMEGHITVLTEENHATREALFTKTLEGNCFGTAMAQLKRMHEKPYKSAKKIALAIKLEEIIYIQLCPDSPLKEKQHCLYAKELENEKSWIEAFKKHIQVVGTKGRLDFSVCSQGSGHTFAFWRSRDSFGYLDGNCIYEYTNQDVFCAALRKEILCCRQYYGKQDTPKEVEEYRIRFGQADEVSTQHFPVFIFTKV